MAVSERVLNLTGEAAAGLTASEQGPAWNLGDLFAGPDDPAIEASLGAADRDATALQAEHQGRLAGQATRSPPYSTLRRRSRI
ncbi:MAG: hypothetical protein U1E17_00990 [Geminicoccaceae bacterium]